MNIQRFAVFLMAACCCWTLDAATKPNVVLILTDDQSWDTFGFMGGKVHTPRLDRMAADGMYLRNFNVTSTVCSPSRYSFLTGRFAGRCEGERFMREHPPGDQTQVENIGELEPHRWNLAKILQSNGYLTGFVGKSHVIRHDWLHTDKSPENARLLGWHPDSDPRDPRINALMKANHQKWCNEIKKYGFDFADGVYAANLKELHCDALNAHNLDWTVDNAMEFLDSADDRPFFLCVSTTLHHGPAPWNNRFSLHADPRMTGEGFVAAGFDVLPSRADVLKRNREAGFQDRGAYALWLDDGVGAIIDKINQLGIAKDTLIVFVPDHGSFRHGKTTLHEYGMRVPMLCLWPGTIQPSSTHDGIIANIDFAPTVLDVCGITPPRDYRYDGKSFKPILLGSDSSLRKVLFGEMGHSRCVKTQDWKYIAVRYPPDVQVKIDRGHKFNAFADHPKLDRPYLTRNAHLGHYASQANPHYFEPNQLYNLKVDPEENDNVFEQHPEVAQRMQEELSGALLQFPNRPFGEFTNDKPAAGPGTNAAGSQGNAAGSGAKTDRASVEGSTVRTTVDRTTLLGKVMCGYQGWFNCAGDGANNGWKHWTRNSHKPFGPGNVTVDLWPDMSDYDPDERYATGFKHADGRTAEVFSSTNPKTVMRHFQWMQDYGIDGAFVQRFIAAQSRPSALSHQNGVLTSARDGANQSGRAFAVMYDLSGLRAGEVERVKKDWRRLEKELKISADAAYLHHKGHPVVAVWGIGFSDDRKYSLDECSDLVAWLKSEGCTVMLGVPSYWRELKRDSVKDQRLHQIIREADIVSPWTVGRYATPQQANLHANEVWSPDRAWCEDEEIDYLPVVFPGFSWHNLNGDRLDSIPRLKGKFLSSQISSAKRIGCNMLYVAMFDEMDEGTAIFKCTNDPPQGDGAQFIGYEGLPSDFYLKMVGNALAK